MRTREAIIFPHPFLALRRSRDETAPAAWAGAAPVRPVVAQDSVFDGHLRLPPHRHRRLPLLGLRRLQARRRPSGGHFYIYFINNAVFIFIL